MKKNHLSRYLAALFLLAFSSFIVSCSMPDSSSQDTSLPDIPFVEDETIALASLNEEGKAMFVKEGGTLTLESAAGESTLYSVEFSSDGGSSRNADPTLPQPDNSNLIKVSDYVYLIRLAENEQIELTPIDYGFTGTYTYVKVKSIQQAVFEHFYDDRGFYFETKIEPTGFDYEEAGYPEYTWPTYEKQYTINPEELDKFKGIEVAIIQYVQQGSNGYRGGKYSDRFGLVTDDGISYDSSLNGLYTLNEPFTFYSYLRTSVYEGDKEYLRTFFIVPQEIQAGQPATVITSMPNVFKFNTSDSSYNSYLIEFSEIPDRYFDNIVSGFLQGGQGSDKNGGFITSLPQIASIEKNNDNTWNISFLINGVQESFISKVYFRDIPEDKNFGKISMVEAKETEPESVEIDFETPETEHEIIFENEVYSKTLYFDNKTGKDWNLRFRTQNIDKIKLFYCTNFSKGSLSPNKDKTLEVAIRNNECGTITVFNESGKENIVTYSLSENNEQH